jgi:hypothetical protein
VSSTFETMYLATCRSVDGVEDRIEKSFTTVRNETTIDITVTVSGTPYYGKIVGYF